MSAWWDAVPEALGEAYADAVVLAVRAGKCDHEWQTVHHEGLSFEISRAPLAIDGRFCLGLSAHAVERIAD